MKILYILPNGTVKSGGNWVTVTRLAGGLRNRGTDVDIVEVKDVTKEKLVKYDIIHAFHAFKSLTKINHLIMDKTVVVSFTGTDLKQLQGMKKNKDKKINVLNKTAAIIVFHNEARNELIKEGILEEKIKVIPPGLDPIKTDDRESEQSIRSLVPPNYIIFLFAGGIRKVKAPLEVIEMMSKLAKKVENIRLIIIGPILETDLGEKVKEKVKGKEWVKYLGETSHQEAQKYISESDIIINSSISEGMPNTLLEAQQMGKPILATDITGNRAIVTHGVDGFLFNDRKEFEYYATKLVQDSNLRERMGLSALENIKKYDLKQEINMYENVYKVSEKFADTYKKAKLKST